MSRIVLRTAPVERAFTRAELSLSGVGTWFSLFLATTICHELAHALTNAREGVVAIEMFYKNDPFAECGIALERQLFGGMVVIFALRTPDTEDCLNQKGGVSHDERLIVHLEPPLYLVADMYEQKGTKFGFRVDSLQYGKVSKFEYSWIASLFTTKFWDERALTTMQYLWPPTSAPWLMESPNSQLIGTHLLACSLNDPSLPLEWQQWLKKIVQRQHQRDDLLDDWQDRLSETCDLRIVQQIETEKKRDKP